MAIILHVHLLPLLLSLDLSISRNFRIHKEVQSIIICRTQRVLRVSLLLRYILMYTVLEIEFPE